MNKFAILLFCALISQTLFAQQAIKITNEITQKEVVIKENRRIKIKTVGGEKIKGRFKIEGNSILIDNEQIALSDIAEIKRNPLLVAILTSSFFIYVGAITAGIGVLAGAFADTSAFYLLIPAAGLIYTGIKSPNFNRKFKSDRDWKFEIITIPD